MENEQNFKKDYTDAVLKLHNATRYGSETWVKRQRGCFTWNFLGNSSSNSIIQYQKQLGTYTRVWQECTLFFLSTALHFHCKHCWWYWAVSKHICYKQKCKAVDKNNSAHRNYKVWME